MAIKPISRSVCFTNSIQMTKFFKAETKYRQPPHSQASTKTNNHTSSSLLGSEFLFRHPLLSLLLELGSPPGKRGPLIDNIADAPQHALLVCFLADVVVRADDVEFAVGHFFVHVVCDLVGGPCANGLFLFRARYVSGLWGVGLAFARVWKEGVGRFTNPVNVHPGTRRWTPTFVSFRS